MMMMIMTITMMILSKTFQVRAEMILNWIVETLDLVQWKVLNLSLFSKYFSKIMFTMIGLKCLFLSAEKFHH